MASEKKQQQQQEGAVAAAATTEPSVARRLWRVVRAVLYMLRRGLPSGRKLAMDLHLLLHRGKVIAGKALGDRFLASSNHHGSSRHGAFSYAGSGASAAGGTGTFSCAALDPSLAVHEPSRRRREVEFSCSNTPSSASGGGGALGLLGAAARRRRRHRRSSRQQHRDEHELDAAAEEASNGYLMPQYYYRYDAAEVARVFEMLSDADDDDEAVPVLAPTPGAATASATPSPALLRLTAGGGSKHGKQQQQQQQAPSPSPVDRRADEFIRRFYEQLRAQRERSAASTPDYYGYAAAASPYVSSAARTPRTITAGIA